MTTASNNAAVQSAAPQPAGNLPLSPSEERTWAMLAHLSVWINLISGFLGVVAAFVIYLVFKDRSRYVAYQSLQSILLQLIAWVGGGLIIGVMWAVTGVLSAVLIGILLIPVACLFSLVFGVLPIAALVYSIVGAVQCSQGDDFRYWLIGDWVRDTLVG